MKKKPPVAMLLAITIAVSFLLALIFGMAQTFGARVDSGISRRVRFTQLWNFTSDKSFVNSPVIENGFVYVTSADSSNEVTLYCLNASSGVQIWNSTGLHYTYAVQDAHVYIGSSVIPSTVFTVEGVVTCLNAYTGARVWNYSLEYTILSPPTVAGNVIFIGASSISERHVDYGGPGAVFALNSTIRELSQPNPPLPPPPSSPPPSPAFPAAIVTMILAIVIVVAVVLTIAFLFLRKRAK